MRLFGRELRDAVGADRLDVRVREGIGPLLKQAGLGATPPISRHNPWNQESVVILYLLDSEEGRLLERSQGRSH